MPEEANQTRMSMNKEDTYIGLLNLRAEISMHSSSFELQVLALVVQILARTAVCVVP